MAEEATSVWQAHHALAVPVVVHRLVIAGRIAYGTSVRKVALKRRALRAVPVRFHVHVRRCLQPPTIDARIPQRRVLSEDCDPSGGLGHHKANVPVGASALVHLR